MGGASTCCNKGSSNNPELSLVPKHKVLAPELKQPLEERGVFSEKEQNNEDEDSLCDKEEDLEPVPNKAVKHSSPVRGFLLNNKGQAESSETNTKMHKGKILTLDIPLQEIIDPEVNIENEIEKEVLMRSSNPSHYKCKNPPSNFLQSPIITNNPLYSSVKARYMNHYTPGTYKSKELVNYTKSIPNDPILSSFETRIQQTRGPLYREMNKMRVISPNIIPSRDNRDDREINIILNHNNYRRRSKANRASVAGIRPTINLIEKKRKKTKSIIETEKWKKRVVITPEPFPDYMSNPPEVKLPAIREASTISFSGGSQTLCQSQNSLTIKLSTLLAKAEQMTLDFSKGNGNSPDKV